MDLKLKKMLSRYMTRNNNQYDLDVIVCCYNPTVDSLIKTLRSIICQKEIHLNLIIADDGSTNNHADVIKKWLFSRNFYDFVFCFSQKNVGTVLNIFQNLKKCKTDYIKTISPGDLLFDEYVLKDMLTAMKKNKSDILFGKQQYYHDAFLFNNMVPDNSKIYGKKDVGSHLQKLRFSVNGASIIYKTYILKKYLRYISEMGIKLVEDNTTLFLSANDKKKISTIDRYVVWYEYSTGVSTSSQNTNNIQYYIDLDHFNAFIFQQKTKLFKKTKEHFLLIKINKHKSKIVRIILKILITPQYCYYRVFKYKKINDTKNTIDMFKFI